MSFLKQIGSYLLNPKANLASLTSAVAPIGGEITYQPERRSRLWQMWRNFPLMVGSIILVGLFLMMLFGPLFVSFDPYVSAITTLPYFDTEIDKMITPPFPPSTEHPLGTDVWGNDMLSFIVYGTRVTLVLGVYITAVRILIGVLVGSAAGWFANRWPDRLVMGMIAVISAVPMLLSSMILIIALDIEKGVPVFVVALSLVGWTEVAQYVRSEVLLIREMPYIEGAEAVGLTELQTMVRHVLPNLVQQVLVITFLEMGAVLILMAELGFLGLYIGGTTAFSLDIFEPPTAVVEIPEWGALVSTGTSYIRSYPHLVLGPATAFFIAVVGVNLIGEGLRRWFERSSVNTSFLLSWRMLLALAGFGGVTALVLTVTGPQLSYARVADEFRGEAALTHAEALAEMEGRGVGQEGMATAAAYIEEKFREYELQRGYVPGLYRNFVYPLTIKLARPLTQPTLTLLDDDGRPVSDFRHQQDFGYLLEGHGGGGVVEAPLAFVGFAEDEAAVPTSAFADLAVNGRVVLLQKGNAPADFPTELLRRGALGVIWLPAADAVVQSQMWVPEGGMQTPRLPILRVGTAVADAILAQAQVGEADLLAVETAVAQGDGWHQHSLAAKLRINLELENPETVEVPTITGFYPAYDMERGHELIIIMAEYDTLGADPDGAQNMAAGEDSSAMGVLLELAHLWQRQNVDPRRSVMFVAWGGGTLDPALIADYLDDEENFKRLSAQTPTDQIRPSMLIYLQDAAGGGDTLWLDPTSDAALSDLFAEAAEENGLAAVQAEEQFIPHAPFSTELPGVYLRLASNEGPSGQTTPPALDAEAMTGMGEAVSLALTRIVRELNY